MISPATAEQRSARAAYMREYMRRRPMSAEQRKRKAVRAKARRLAVAMSPAQRASRAAYMQTYNKDYAARNKLTLRAYHAEYGRRNATTARARTAAWKKANRAKVSAAVLARRSVKRSRIHPKSDRAEEVRQFERADHLTQTTGELHHVDHIIPLAAGGWHHHANLQVLPAIVNMTKHADPFWSHPDFKSWRDVPRALWPEKLEPEYTAILAREQAVAA